MIRSRHRVTIWLAILGYALVASGLPLPLGGVPVAADRAAAKRLAGKDRSRPFPCMDKPCGCATAEQCFSNCCCNTPSQTLAWAKAHRLNVAVIAALERRAADATQDAPQRGDCCSAKASCCTTTNPSAEAMCCDSRSTAAEPDGRTDPARPIDEGRSGSVYLVLRAMLACGGIATGWSAATMSLPPPPAIRSESCVCVVGTIVIVNDVGLSADLSCDSPPPRA